MRPGSLLATLSACATLSAASPARADNLAPALVRLLTSPGNAHPLADATGRIPLSVALPPGVDAASLGLLPVAPGIGAIRLAVADVAPFAAAHPGLAVGVAPPIRPLLDVSGTWTHVSQFQSATGYYGQGVIVGVIDTGLDVLHPDFRTADGHSRVAWMLVAGSPAGLHPAEEAAFGCTDPNQTPCAIYAAADIDAMIAKGLPVGADNLQDPEGHGTHVSSIAAGNGGPSVNKAPRYVGLAPEATLIVAAPTAGGGFVDTDILNAARFVFDRAEVVGGPVVVNLSLGTDYGPHDGSSVLETGLSAMVGDDQPGRAIVVAAGNSGELTVPLGGGGPLGIHTEVHVGEGEVARVPIVAGAANSGTGYVWITFSPGAVVDVGLEGPGGSTWVGLTSPGNEAGYQSGSGMSALQGGVINDLPGADAKLAGTNSAVVVFSGHWDDESELAVILRGTGDASLWITAEGDAVQGLFFEKAIRQGTINVPASAPGLLAVGCTLNRIAWTPLGGPRVTLSAVDGDSSPVPDSACSFSASGPTPAGVQKPELSAPGAFVGAAMSADADPRRARLPGGLFDLAGCPPDSPFCAVLDDYHALASGTSMSSAARRRRRRAPHGGRPLAHPGAGHRGPPGRRPALQRPHPRSRPARPRLARRRGCPPGPAGHDERADRPRSVRELVHAVQHVRPPRPHLAGVGHRRAAQERRLHRRRHRRLQPDPHAPGRRRRPAPHPGVAGAVAVRRGGAAHRSRRATSPSTSPTRASPSAAPARYRSATTSGPPPIRPSRRPPSAAPLPPIVKARAEPPPPWQPS